MRRGDQVLAHSLAFDPTLITPDMPMPLQSILRSYQSSRRHAPRLRGERVDPLLRTQRHQHAPYNQSCPYYTYTSGGISTERCVVGCVATAIEQVLTYYRHPACLLDTLHGWETSHYVIDDILPDTPIDWTNILDDYNCDYTPQQAKAVADLSYYCGVAAHMNWGPSSSGAHTGSAVDALYEAFGYRTIAYVPRWLYSSDSWNRMLRHELACGRPIVYTGHNMALSGHAFNIDGVDEEGYYHINWGYGGNYDGWFDLDYLDTFEAPSDPTHLGQYEGHSFNQTALFMHPDDFVIDISDTIPSEHAYYAVEVSDVTFRRSPDCQEYTIADVHLSNPTTDTIYYTFEALTYEEGDTAIFMQADYVGLVSVEILPGQSLTAPLYCRFTEPGNRIFALSTDDETFTYQAPVNILPGTPSELAFGDVTCQQTRYGDDLTATLTLDITNLAPEGFSGDLVTYCLFPEDSSLDLRHWQVLQLEAGQSVTDSVTFRHLIDGQKYTLRIRCPWEVVKEFSFVANSREAVDAIIQPSMTTDTHTASYDLQGRRTPNTFRGIIIRNGHKYIMP